MKAYVYARYSSDRQNEQSIEGQLRECYAYAEAHGIEIIAEYIDRAISGKTDDRPDFRRMIADSAGGDVEAVIVYRTDRFSRNRYDSAVYKAQLKKHGVRVLYAKEPIPEGIEGILLESLLEGMAEYYSAELSQKIHRGMHESALKCQCTGGNIALGYKIGPDKKFYLDEETAPIVVMIFEMYSKGATCTEIIRHLNSLGLKTTRGKPYNKSTLRSLLKNEKYIGVYKVKDVRIEGGVPAIVDKELFNSVQQRLEFNSRLPQRKRAKVDYLLSGKLYCDCCKHLMTGYCGTGKSGKVHHYYKCSGGKPADCSMPTIKKDWIESLVCSETVEKILNPDMMNFISERCAEFSAEDASRNDEADMLKKRIADIDKSIDGILSAMEQGIFTRSTKERLESLEKQKETAEREYEAAKKRVPILLKHEIKYLLSRFTRETSDTLESYNRDLINCFVNKAILKKDRIIIVYNLSTDGKTLYQSERFFDLPPTDPHAPPHTDHSTLTSPECSPTDHLAPPPNTKAHRLARWAFMFSETRYLRTPREVAESKYVECKHNQLSFEFHKLRLCCNQPSFVI